MSLIVLSTDDASTVTLDELTPHSEAWARELVTQRWLMSWPLQTPTCDGIVEREPAELPASSPYAVVSFRYEGGKRMTLGRRHRVHHRATIGVRIWTLDDEGGLLASQLADSARTVFSDIELSSSSIVTSLCVQSSETPQSQTIGKWHQQLVTWPCYWYEQRQ